MIDEKYFLSGWPGKFDTEKELQAYKRGLQDAGALSDEVCIRIAARYAHTRPLGVPDEW